MFERFTHRARRVLVLAQEEARLLNHSFIGTEHLLLGLIHEGDSVAAKVLESFDVSLEAVREEVVAVVGPSLDTPTGSPPFTPRAKKVLELSLREALQLGHHYIATGHMLLGLLREGEGVAVQVLVSLGTDLNELRQTAIHLLVQHEGQDGGGEGAGGSHSRPERVGTQWSVVVVCAGRGPAEFADAQRKVMDLAGNLGVVVNEVEVSVTSVETEDGPGLRLSYTHRFDDDAEPGGGGDPLE